MIFFPKQEEQNRAATMVVPKDAQNKCSQISRTNVKALLKSKGWKGKWSGREELKYIRFIQQNKQTMQSHKERVASKIFLRMSKVLRSRNPNQCRSHHQKLIQYHGNVENIITYYQRVVFKRWANIIKDRPSELQRIAAIKRICANPQLNYTIRVLASTIKIEIAVQSVAAFCLD